MSASLIGTVIGTIIVVIWWLTSRPEPGSREAAFVTTPKTEIVPLEAITSLSTMKDPGPFLVRTYRQSGNLHQADRIVETADEALRAATSTFRRSRIAFVVVVAANEYEFSFRRPWHDHRGHREGKKVGWIEIHRASPRAATTTRR